MKKTLFLLLAVALSWGAAAQTMEELTSYDQTFKSRLSPKQRADRFKARHKPIKQGERMPIQTDNAESKDGMDIFPDTLYAGEPFDVHFGTTEGNEATFELYDLRGKRAKRMAWKRASTNINGYTVVRITLEEPGTYEVVAYDEAFLMMTSNPELVKSRWTISVRKPRKE